MFVLPPAVAHQELGVSLWLWAHEHGVTSSKGDDWWIYEVAACEHMWTWACIFATAKVLIACAKLHTETLYTFAKCNTSVVDDTLTLCLAGSYARDDEKYIQLTNVLWNLIRSEVLSLGNTISRRHFFTSQLLVSQHLLRSMTLDVIEFLMMKICFETKLNQLEMEAESEAFDQSMTRWPPSRSPENRRDRINCHCYRQTSTSSSSQCGAVTQRRVRATVNFTEIAGVKPSNLSN